MGEHMFVCVVLVTDREFYSFDAVVVRYVCLRKSEEDICFLWDVYNYEADLLFHPSPSSKRA